MGKKKAPPGKKGKPLPPLNPKQSRFAKEFAKGRNLRESAILAGYPPKNASQSGRQVLDAIAERSPEVMRKLGLTLERVIEKHLTPLLNATETKFSQFEGEFTDFVEVADNGIRLGATRAAFELLNAFPPRDPALAAQVGVDVIVLDVPRPDRTIAVKARVKVAVTSAEDESPTDPRPKD